jgi:hypothetical protein
MDILLTLCKTVDEDPRKSSGVVIDELAKQRHSNWC